MVLSVIMVVFLSSTQMLRLEGMGVGGNARDIIYHHDVSSLT